MAVTPTMPVDLVLGATRQFKVMGVYSVKSAADITSKVTWNSSNNSVDTIVASGLASGVGIGSTNITVSMSGINSSIINLRR